MNNPSQSIQAPVLTEESAQIQDEIQRYLNEIERSQERMAQTHQEIERSKNRTRAMLKEISELRIA